MSQDKTRLPYKVTKCIGVSGNVCTCIHAVKYGGLFVPFRYFVFSHCVMARRQDEITPSEKTK